MKLPTYLHPFSYKKMHCFAICKSHYCFWKKHGGKDKRDECLAILIKKMCENDLGRGALDLVNYALLWKVSTEARPQLFSPIFLY